MNRWTMTAALTGVCLTLLADAHAQAVRPLAQDHVAIFESPQPDKVYLYSPGMERCPDGRLIATFDLGGRESRPIIQADPNLAKGMIYTSDDHGQTWTRRGTSTMHFMRPFVAGDAVYVLGVSGRELKIMRSDDNGATWGGEHKLSDKTHWHQSACNVWYTRGNVYLVMERETVEDFKGWSPSVLAPILMRAKVNDDLTKAESWTFATELSFRDAVDVNAIDGVAIPFYPFKRDDRVDVAPRRSLSAPGWLETNVVQVMDENHYWYDPTGRTFHLFMRAHTAGTGYAAMAKVVEQEDGSMVTQLETVPSGKTAAFLPMPGGQMRFHMLYDEQTKLYWLLSTQATDSMTRADRLPPDRYNLPNNERQRLVLHFSRNLVDWSFAGLVAMGGSQGQARHYASMVIDGDDLHVLSRSGDARAKSAHDGNLITFHTVKNFRDLVW